MKKKVPELIAYYKSWLSKYPFVSIEAIFLRGRVRGELDYYWVTEIFRLLTSWLKSSWVFRAKPTTSDSLFAGSTATKLRGSAGKREGGREGEMWWSQKRVEGGWREGSCEPGELEIAVWSCTRFGVELVFFRLAFRRVVRFSFDKIVGNKSKGELVAPRASPPDSLRESKRPLVLGAECGSSGRAGEACSDLAVGSPPGS